MKFYFLSCIILIFISLISCGDNDLLNVEKIDFDTHSQWIIPIGHGNITLQQLLDSKQNTTGFLADNKNRIYLRHDLKNIYSAELNDFLNLPEEILKMNKTFRFSKEISINRNKLTKFTLQEDRDTASLHFPNIGSVSELRGSLKFSLTVSAPVSSFQAEYTFPTIKNSAGEPLKLVFNLKKNKDFYIEKVLNNYTLHADDNQVYYDVKIAPLLDNTDLYVPAGYTFSMNFKVEKMDIDYIKGNFTPNTYLIPAKNYQIDMPLFKNVKNLSFNSAVVRLNVKSQGIHAPITYSPFITAKSETKNINLSVKKSVSLLANSMSGLNTDILEINGENSNIDELVSLSTIKNISVSGGIIVNEKGELKNCEITKNASLSMDGQVIIPMRFKLEQYNVSLKMKNIGFFSQKNDMLKSLKIVLQVKTDIPLIFVLNELVLLDEKTIKTGTIKVEKEISGIIPSEGNAAKISESKVEIALTREEMERLLECKEIRVNGNFKSSGKDFVSLESENFVEIKIISDLSI